MISEIGAGGLISYGSPAPPSGVTPVVQDVHVKQKIPPPREKKTAPTVRKITPKRKKTAPQDDLIEELLPKVKANLVLSHDEDDVLLRGMIAASIAYAEERQHKPTGDYFRCEAKMSPTTEHAIIILASHFYESRDGSTGGFFNDKVDAGKQTWAVVNNLLSLNKEVIF